ncbi:uncharacterized protein LOC108471000 isoform X3 [Gossypium arboreum]|uniref:uncharacterized protein LOC108471000 isoform X3 n=1 Tax=Gossypium arboreum TaxID=29729 RepID=UPI0022F19452|nr:uncharacterized protein LOC108471000 isoform X3 [Gossypium arboreum]
MLIATFKIPEFSTKPPNSFPLLWILVSLILLLMVFLRKTGIWSKKWETSILLLFHALEFILGMFLREVQIGLRLSRNSLKPLLLLLLERLVWTKAQKEGRLILMIRDIGSFPDGLLLHSYLGSAEMVPEFVKSGAYFSLSGYIMPMKVQKAKKMLKTIPLERILLESDAPDALPHLELSSLFLVDEDPSLPQEIFAHGRTAASNVSTSSDTSRDAYSLPKDMLNHPANIHNVLDYVANLLEIRKEELAEISYKNSIRLFSYQGSKFALG